MIKWPIAKKTKKKPPSVVFLDIDGVLNRKSDWVRHGLIREECVRALSLLCRELSCHKIVLSSSWRTGDTSELQGVLQEYGLCIVVVTPLSSKTRAEEIAFYARREGLANYLILDDDESLFGENLPKELYLVNHLTGLTERDVAMICKRYKL